MLFWCIRYRYTRKRIGTCSSKTSRCNFCTRRTGTTFGVQVRFATRIGTAVGVQVRFAIRIGTAVGVQEEKYGCNGENHLKCTFLDFYVKTKSFGRK
ncbi:hypothetical protein V6N13_004784 [Hibiscus sabdariffa]